MSKKTEPAWTMIFVEMHKFCRLATSRLTTSFAKGFLSQPSESAMPLKIGEKSTRVWPQKRVLPHRTAKEYKRSHLYNISPKLKDPYIRALSAKTRTTHRHN